ncbi:hypothetical protein GCM10007874_68630 [Labrys miyagiensis]|uniref:DUF2852 domain-containing protein n=2 Tax=Labrys miyagiensis TaxID=346912 RepID=A0ABQ6CW43_9HYPH|nr:DUF2852 domain-containing protein [Labrys miyagiensis]GLS23842.1 hypothetical protein GCM10007874_68630 [Labrys miyagiensis]
MTSCSTRGRWHPLHVVAVIAGFMIWWPLGLAALAYFIWGDRFPREKVRDGFERAKAEFTGFGRDYRGYGFAGQGWSGTGNAAFDDYRRETLRRLEEERRRIEEEGRAFAEFVANLRRARDKEEFDRFMAERNASRNNGEGPNV